MLFDAKLHKTAALPKMTLFFPVGVRQLSRVLQTVSNARRWLLMALRDTALVREVS
jgi:hypothetical protein